MDLLLHNTRFVTANFGRNVEQVFEVLLQDQTLFSDGGCAPCISANSVLVCLARAPPRYLLSYLWKCLHV